MRQAEINFHLYLSCQFVTSGATNVKGLGTSNLIRSWGGTLTSGKNSAAQKKLH